MTTVDLPTWAPTALHRTTYPTVTRHAPADARHWARTELSRHAVPADIVDTVELIVSELVTNVYRHAHGEAEVTLNPESDGTLTLTCADRCDGEIPSYEASINADDISAAAESGRGLSMIARMCCGYVVRTRMHGGKRIVVFLETKEN